MDADGGGCLPRPLFRLVGMISWAHWSSYQRGRAEQPGANRRRALCLPLFPSLSLRAVARTAPEQQARTRVATPRAPLLFPKDPNRDVCERGDGRHGKVSNWSPCADARKRERSVLVKREERGMSSSISRTLLLWVGGASFVLASAE